MEIRISSPALAELNHAAAYYEASRSGLAEEFASEFGKTLMRIKMAPKAGSLYDENVRCQMLRRFPYSVYYTEKGNELVIVAVAHQHRKPGYWLGRVTNTNDDKTREPESTYSANSVSHAGA